VLGAPAPAPADAPTSQAPADAPAAEAASADASDAPPAWPVITGPLPAWPVSRVPTAKPVPAQREPAEDEQDTDEPETVESIDTSGQVTAPESADVETDAEAEAAAPDRAPTLVATAPGPLARGPADATTPARPHPVRAIAKVVATPALGADPASRRRRMVAVALVLIVLLVGGAWLVMRDSDVDGSRGDKSGAGPAATATQTEPTSEPSAGNTGAPADPTTAPPANNATPAPGDQRPGVPNGWREYTDPTGFSLYVPANWRVSREGTMVYFRGDGRVLGIDQTNEPQPDPVADWRGKASYRVGRGDFPNYSEIHIQAVPFWQKAADWEFTYSGSAGRTHVNNRGFIVSSHKAYGIWWQAPDSDWADAWSDLQLIFESFRPSAEALN
jgi:hypothetical protein